MADLIRVAAIDDHPLILKGFAGFLAGAPGFEYVGGYTTVVECLSQATADAAVLDVHLDDGSRPADNVRSLKRAGVAVLMVSTDDEVTTVIGAIEAGADGYLRKSADLTALTDAIRDAVAGGQPISPELAFILVRDDRAQRPELTEREREVLSYFGSGLPWERVAERLGMKYATIKVHLRNIRAKYYQG